jgi:hypothetical protein
MYNGFSNQLWAIDTRPGPAQLQWTFLAGSTQVDCLGSFGVRGVPSLSNFPSAAQQQPLAVGVPFSVLNIGPKCFVRDRSEVWRFVYLW